MISFHSLILNIERKTTMPTSNSTIKSKPVTQIYATTDYDQFTYAAYNREVNPNRVKRLAKNIENADNVPPIEVIKDAKSHKLTIIDGQIRFQALQSNNLPVHYYLSYGTDEKTTVGIANRNTTHNWSALDRIHSFAANDNNFADVKVTKKVRKEYQKLLNMIDYTQNKLGKTPIVPIIEAAEGINHALNQPYFKRADYNWRVGSFQSIHQKKFNRTINTINQIQTKAVPFRMSAATFRAFFAICADTSINTDYFTWVINKETPTFQAILEQTNAVDLTVQLIDFYNRFRLQYKRRGPKPQPISYTMSTKHKVIIQSINFDRDLFLS